MTRPLETLVCLAILLLLFIAMLAAAVEGQHLRCQRIHCTSPAVPEGVGEAPKVPQVTVWTRVPTKAADRSRPLTTPRAVGSGELLDVTSYCETGNRTASGVWPHVGMAAGNRWPFGTRLRVPGAGVVTVEDRIGWGSDLDLYAPSCAAARQWGRRHLLVEEVR